MAKLENTFSWSYSAGTAFEQCRRRRYWDKYGKWGGWKKDAAPTTRQAYLLSKMTSRHALAGDAVERGVEAMLTAARAGRPMSVEAVFDKTLRPFLRSLWNESRTRAWQQDAKRCNLHEHYYPEFHPGKDGDYVRQVADIVKGCLANFEQRVLPRLRDIPRESEVSVDLPGRGDPEHFFLDGIKIYAIPDLVYRAGEDWHIIDWKSGSARAEHRLQLGVYALWANRKHGVEPERIQVALEYLRDGATVCEPVDSAFLDKARASILTSIQDMADYLENGDLQRNAPRPRAEWDLAPDFNTCRLCPFLELCEPELKELGVWPDPSS